MIAASPNWRSRSSSSVRRPSYFASARREVRRDDRLARPALRREDRDDPPVRADRGGQAAAGVRRLADREDDVLGQLRKQQDVGDVRLEGVLEQVGRLARGDEDDRRPGQLADGDQLVRRQARRARRVEHDLQMSAGERGCGSCDVLARTRGARAPRGCRASRAASRSRRKRRSCRRVSSQRFIRGLQPLARGLEYSVCARWTLHGAPPVAPAARSVPESS